MNTLDYILDKWNLRGKKSPIEMVCSRKATLPKILRTIDCRLGVEVGVERAVYSKILCMLVPNMKLYGVDAWSVYKGYRDHVGQKTLDEFFKSTKQRMRNSNFQAIKELSIKAAERFEDESLDFVFIDAAHDYKSVKEDIKAWDPKVRKGGIVSGHDYMNLDHTDRQGVKTAYGVKRAVNEWVKKKKIKHLFILKKDKCPSWFYVK